MSVIDCDYLPAPEPITFPPELALLIVRKAAAMAEAFESKALDQMTRDVSRALRDGMEPAGSSGRWGFSDWLVSADFPNIRRSLRSGELLAILCVRRYKAYRTLDASHRAWSTVS